MATHFLNVDLEVTSDRNLQVLADAFGEKARYHLSSGEAPGETLATFEIGLDELEMAACTPQKRNDGGEADAKIRKFCSLIRELKGEAKEVWETASSKTFDLGYEGGLSPHYYLSNLSPETMGKIAEVGASLKVTIYPIDMREAG
ncbi:hypothetical protein [Oscillatoria sp. FACHB-1406]|uniref:hypothetical protein n=1 Tax=Oscillatoria sp. FACHB-1406 TaxID=2692846 RepID=UPI0016847DBE|nr:hypothetical protein [Oscillatoria sp. FACHB-1406]MBD2576598.1 hypothetical protein [Oscillatoria sp. FACHB-1406]